MKTLQSAPWKFRWQPSLQCTLQCWTTRYRREGYELSYLKYLEFSWEDPAVDMDSVYRPGVETPFLPSILDIFQMGPAAANQILVDDEEH